MTQRLAVFGGSGFVGSYICRQAAKLNVPVISLSRRGMPSWKEPWMDRVEWAKADMFDPSSYRSILKECKGTIVSVGAFGNNDFMERVCGDGPMTILETSKEENVKRFAFLSAQKAAGTPDWLLSGYFKGKQKVEVRMQEIYEDAHMALQPGFVYGSRKTDYFPTPLPLSVVGAPLRALTTPQFISSLEAIPLIGQGLIPPASAQDIAELSIEFMKEEDVDKRLCGNISSRDIRTLAASFR